MTINARYSTFAILAEGRLLYGITDAEHPCSTPADPHPIAVSRNKGYINDLARSLRNADFIDVDIDSF